MSLRAFGRTVESYRDLLLRLGLPPLADTHEKGRS
jgi:hypothetical protein